MSGQRNLSAEVSPIDEDVQPQPTAEERIARGLVARQNLNVQSARYLDV